MYTFIFLGVVMISLHDHCSTVEIKQGYKALLVNKKMMENVTSECKLKP